MITLIVIMTTGCRKNEEIPDTITDVDGNVYHTLIIANQVWLKENLKTSRLKDGTAIPIVTVNSDWANLTAGAYCWYNNDSNLKDLYGALYNWHAVNTGKLCPTGWHVPDDTEWKELEKALGMSQADADDLDWRGTNVGSKLAGDATLWTDGTLENDAEFGSSGFSAFPGGYRFSPGAFLCMGDYGLWWTATEYSSIFVWSRYIGSDYSKVFRWYDDKGHGYSVRCIMD